MLRTLNQKLLLVSLTTLTAVALLLGIAVSTVLMLRQSTTDLIVDNHETELLGQIDTNLVRAAGEAATFAGVGDADYLDEAREALERARTALRAIEQIPHNDSVISTDLQHEDLIQRQAA